MRTENQIKLLSLGHGRLYREFREEREGDREREPICGSDGGNTCELDEIVRKLPHLKTVCLPVAG